MIFQIEKWKNDIFHVFPQGPPWSSRPHRFKAVLLLLPKKATLVAKNFGCCKGRSQLSVDIFMASGDLLVAQKCYFLQKSPQKTRNTTNPPPCLAECVIYSQKWPILGHFGGIYFEVMIMALVGRNMQRYIQKFWTNYHKPNYFTIL